MDWSPDRRLLFKRNFQLRTNRQRFSRATQQQSTNYKLHNPRSSMCNCPFSAAKVALERICGGPSQQRQRMTQFRERDARKLPRSNKNVLSDLESLTYTLPSVVTCSSQHAFTCFSFRSLTCSKHLTTSLTPIFTSRISS